MHHSTLQLVWHYSLKLVESNLESKWTPYAEPDTINILKIKSIGSAETFLKILPIKVFSKKSLDALYSKLPWFSYFLIIYYISIDYSRLD